MAVGEIGICRRCKREIPVYSRELCKSCYTYIRLKIKGGKTSWAEMMDKGWAGDRAPCGRPATVPSLDAMKRAAGLSSEETPLFPEIMEMAKIAGYYGKCLECDFSSLEPIEVFKHKKETGHAYTTKAEESSPEVLFPTSD